MTRKSYTSRMLRLLSGVTAMLIAMVVVAAFPAMAEGLAGQKGFASPQQAVAALVTAVQDDDDAELLAILGAGSEDLISSGDKVADQNARARFLKAYEEKNSLEQKTEDREELVVGGKDLEGFRREYGIPDTGWGRDVVFPGYLDQADLPAG